MFDSSRILNFARFLRSTILKESTAVRFGIVMVISFLTYSGFQVSDFFMERASLKFGFLTLQDPRRKGEESWWSGGIYSGSLRPFSRFFVEHAFWPVMVKSIIEIEGISESRLSADEEDWRIELEIPYRGVTEIEFKTNEGFRIQRIVQSAEGDPTSYVEFIFTNRKFDGVWLPETCQSASQSAGVIGTQVDVVFESSPKYVDFLTSTLLIDFPKGAVISDELNGNSWVAGGMPPADTVSRLNEFGRAIRDLGSYVDAPLPNSTVEKPTSGSWGRLAVVLAFICLLATAGFIYLKGRWN